MLLLEYDKNRFYAEKAITPRAGPTLIEKAVMVCVKKICAIYNQSEPPKILMLDEYWYFRQACLAYRKKLH